MYCTAIKYPLHVFYEFTTLLLKIKHQTRGQSQPTASQVQLIHLASSHELHINSTHVCPRNICIISRQFGEQSWSDSFRCGSSSFSLLKNETIITCCHLCAKTNRSLFLSGIGDHQTQHSTIHCNCENGNRFIEHLFGGIPPFREPILDDLFGNFLTFQIYESIFMIGGRKNIHDPDHNQFIECDFLSHRSLKQL